MLLDTTKWNQSGHQTKETTMSTNQPTYGEMIEMVELYIFKQTGNSVKIALPRNVGEIKKKLIHAYKKSNKSIMNTNTLASKICTEENKFTF